MKTTTITLTLVVLLGLCIRPVEACTGDCNNDGVVTVDEVIQGVNIALGSAAVTRCQAFDVDTNATVTVDEVVLAVNSALRGCPVYAGEYNARIDLDDQVADIEFTVDAEGDIVGELTLSPIPRILGRGQAAGGTPITGSVNFSTGAFSISGTAGSIPFSVSGTLPSSPGGGSITIMIGGFTYSGSFGAAKTPTPTPTQAGTTHIVKVGQPNLPFDPELLEINPGETVVWTWVGGTHSVRSSIPGTCNTDGLFDSGGKSSGTFSYTFNAAGTYEYHCNIATHCQQFETGIVIVRGTPTATPSRTATRTATPPSTPTATATADVIDGVSHQILGFFSGQIMNQFGGSFPERIQIEQTGTAQVRVTDLTGNVLGQFGQLTLTADTPTKISYSNPDPFNMRSLTLELVGGHLTGTFVTGSVGMGTFTLTFDLVREP